MAAPGPVRRACRVGRGFSLIELMVAVALLGILIRLGFPSFSAWVRNAQVRTVGEALQNGLRLAQAEALRQNRPVVMAFTNVATSPAPAAGTAAPWTAVASGKNWWLQTVPQFSDSAAQFIAGGTFSDVASGVLISGPPAICFNSNGRVVAMASSVTGVNGGTCTVAATTTFVINQPNPNSATDHILNVTVKVGGQVRLCDSARVLSPTVPDGC